jgi:uncharacterized sulfatase
VEIPDHLQGRPFLGTPEVQSKEYLYGFRGRLDDRYDLIRTVTDGRYQYIRNFMPHLPWFGKQTREYPKLQPSYQAWHRLAAAGELKGSNAIFMADAKPREELYDLEADPHQVKNLAGLAEYDAVLRRMRVALRDKIVEIKDLGFVPESQRALRLENDNPSTSIYEIVRQSPRSYPLEQILETADLLGLGKAVIEEQIRGLEDTDAAVRFWSAMGLLAQGELAAEAKAELLEALNDPAPSVRILAAHTLAELGETDRSFPVLLELLNHAHPYVSLRAANALDHLGFRIEPIVEQVLAPLEHEPDESVYNSHYPHRILRAIAERFEMSQVSK